jgi:hypothetical protein
MRRLLKELPRDGGAGGRLAAAGEVEETASFQEEVRFSG